MIPFGVSSQITSVRTATLPCHCLSPVALLEIYRLCFHTFTKSCTRNSCLLTLLRKHPGCTQTIPNLELATSRGFATTHVPTSPTPLLSPPPRTNSFIIRPYQATAQRGPSC